MNRKQTAYLRLAKLIAILFPAVLLILFFPVNDFDDTTRIRGFYMEEPHSLDVIVMGSSENYAGYSPVLAYDEYGFTSYPYVFSANAFTIFEPQLEEVLRVQSPKLIVVDIGEILQVRKTSYDTVLRQFTACMPLSRHKIETIHKYGDSEHILSYYLPFIVNHGKADWNTVWGYIQDNAAMDRRGYSLLKGTLTFTGSGENWDGPYVTPINTSGDHSTAELSPDVIEQVQSVIAACQKYPDQDFLFINTPHRITTEDRYLAYQKINTVGKLLEDSGYDFLNLESMTDEIGLIPETDFYNNHHMNLYGQYKTTRFLCEILKEEYGIGPSPLSSSARQNWDTCAAYRPLYYQLFEKLFSSRDPEEFGDWMQENIGLLSQLEEMKQMQ